MNTTDDNKAAGIEQEHKEYTRYVCCNITVIMSRYDCMIIERRERREMKGKEVNRRSQAIKNHATKTLPGYLTSGVRKIKLEYFSEARLTCKLKYY